MFPAVTWVSVTDQLSTFWAEPVIGTAVAVSIALALAPRLLRLLKRAFSR